jgi:DNA polymerase III delta subunit
MRISNFSSFLTQKSFESTRALLFYGNDEGALQFHVDLLWNAFKKAGYRLETAHSLEAIDTGHEPGLFDPPTEKRVTLCLDITGRDFPALEEKLSQLPDTHTLIIVAGNLGSKTKMATTFQQSKNLAAVAVYDLSPALLQGVLLAQIQARKITLSKEHLQVLIETYLGSPVSLLSDMEKLELYLKSHEIISLEDLKNLMNGAEKLHVDLLIEGFLERDKNKVLTYSDVSLLEAEPYLILRSLIRQMLTFSDYQSHRAFTASPAQAMAALKVPLFFSTKPLFERVDRRWNLKLAAHALRHLLVLEKRFKNGDLSLMQFQSELCLLCA